MTTSFDRVATELFEQHRQNLPFSQLAETARNGPLSDAYTIQEALQERFVGNGSGPIAGYKVALTSVAMQEFVGVDQPLAGAIFASRTHDSPATIDLAAYQHVGVECEIAVRLVEDLPERSNGYSAESVALAVGAVMPAFELIEDRHADYGKIDAFSLVADNAWNAGIVLGPACESWRDLDLLSTAGTLQINGEKVDEGKGADALGNPLAAVAWLADLLNSRGRKLERGMVVMTGSLVKTVFPGPGDVLQFSLEGIGDVTLCLEENR